ncbi:MAG: hypothetical protein PSX81_12120 [bacterium]|nr:hypothetical protein [bacterium]
MKITKHIVMGVLFITMILFVGFYIITLPFRLSSMIDGETNRSSEGYISDEFALNKNIYLDTRTYFLVQRMNKELSKIIIVDTIDSLCWNDTKIIGHANKKYFIVNVFDKDSTTTKYYLSKHELNSDNTLYQTSYNCYYNLPVISGFTMTKS